MNIDHDNQPLKLVGRIIKIFPEKKTSDFHSQVQVIFRTGQDYPQNLMIRFVNESIKFLDFYQVGELVEIHFKLKGKIYDNNKDGSVIFTNFLEVFRIFKAN